MAELITHLDNVPSEGDRPDLSVVDSTDGWSPYPVEYADFFNEPGAALTVVTQTGKRVRVESTNYLDTPAYCQGSVGIGKGTCTGPSIEPGENHIETRVEDPEHEGEYGRRFYHTSCYVQHKLSYAADIVDVKPVRGEPEPGVLPPRRVSKEAMIAIFGPAPQNPARRRGAA